MRILSVLLIMALIMYGAEQATAQDSLLAALNPAKLKDGYAMYQGGMIQIKDGQMNPLDQDITLRNGTKIYRNGYVVLPGQKKQKLQEAYAVNMNGKIVMLQYDMMRYDAIQDYSQNLLGSTETQVIITDKGIAVAATPEQKEATEKMLSRRMAIISERNALVKQKADLLNKAKNVKEQRNSPAIKSVDTQIQQLTDELKQIEQKLQQL